jgi:hypothetical protein
LVLQLTTRNLTFDFPSFPFLNLIQNYHLSSNLWFLQLGYPKAAPPNFQSTLKISANLDQLFEVSQQLEFRILVVLAVLGSEQLQLSAEDSVSMVEKKRLVV